MGTARASVLDTLERRPGNHLVFVRYEPSHNPHHEWVHNDADIDESRVVWLREPTTAAEFDQATTYFADRNTWWLFADEDPPRLEQANGPK